MRILLLLVSLLAPIAAGQAAIDLNPTVKDFVDEGMNVRELTFKDGPRHITLRCPINWNVRGGGDRLQLTPPSDKKFAEASIQAIPLPAPQPLDENLAKALEQQVLSGVPPGSQAVEVIKREENPVLLNGNPSFEVAVSYKVMGEAFQRSVILVNTPETQLVFRITARKPDFDPLNKLFRLSIQSWTWSEPAAARLP